MWNGLSLCSNHHTAFDRHLVAVDPDSRAVTHHPRVLDDAEKNEATKHYVDRTFPVLAAPAAPADAPKGDMFKKRYEFFDPKYHWLTAA